MNHIVHIFAEHLVNALVSQSAEAGRVAERAPVFEINSVNGFGSRVEKKSKFILALAQCLFRLLAFGDVTHHRQRPIKLSIVFDQRAD